MNRISLLIYGALGWLLNKCSPSVFYAISNVFAWLLQHIFRYRRSVITANMRMAFPKISKQEIRALRKTYYQNFADLSLETLIGPRMNKAILKSRFEFVNPQDVDQHNNTIIVGGHQGNWEWGVLAVSLWLQKPVTGVYKPLKNKTLDNYFKGKREQWGLKTIPLLQTVRWLRSHRGEAGHLVLIADQSPSNAKTAKWVDFLGQQTAFSVGPEKIGNMTKWPVFFFEVRQKKRGYYTVEFKPLESGKSITESFALALERSIEQAPANWLWSHKRWKKTFKY